MKNVILTLLILLNLSFLNAKEIEVIVVFENLTNKKLIEGEFFVSETNLRIKITKIESFKIILPGKGRYQFGFTSKEFTTYAVYPAKITDSNNKIIIQLTEKKPQISNHIFSLSMKIGSNLTEEQIEQRIENRALNFIIHGIDSSIPKGYLSFEEKYGIGLIKRNCVIDPISFKNASENNQMIFEYLNKKYGLEWQTELNIKPFGLK